MDQVHRRQYVIGPRRHDGWPAVPVGAGFVSHHPDLSCRQVDASSGTWTLLGEPTRTQGGPGNVEADLAQLVPGDVRATTRSWAGRWLLIDPDGLVHLDPSGLLGCVFRRDGGATWASSSPALASTLPGLPALQSDGRRLQHQRGANWHAGPGAGYIGLDRLLPSQGLRLDTGEVVPRALLPRLQPRTAEDVAAEVQQRLTRAMEDLVSRSPVLWIALTAGIDSRTMLACAVAAGLPVQTFTHLHDRMSLADRELPPLLARTAGVPHRFTQPQALDERRLAVYDGHSADAAQDRDRDWYARGQWDFLGVGDAVVRANAFEIARSSWHRGDAQGHVGSAIPPMDVIIPFLREEPRSVFERDLNRWRAWACEHPEPDLLWQDRIYWEQRLGAWAATTEQSLDLLDGHSVVLANCQAVIEGLLSLPESDRVAKSAQKALIAAAAPALSAIPLNPARKTFPLRARYRDATRHGLRPTTTAAAGTAARRAVRAVRRRR